MKAFLRFLVLAVFILPAISSALAEEQNGLSVTVGKTVLENNDTRGGGYYYDRINRTQGLQAVIKNQTFKPMPEGELVWVILVRKWGYADYIEKYTGTEKIKALKPADSDSLIFGNAPVTGYKDMGTNEKDKVEWQVIVKQEGKEMLKAQSTSTFDSLAKHAVKATPTKGGGN